MDFQIQLNQIVITGSVLTSAEWPKSIAKPDKEKQIIIHLNSNLLSVCSLFWAIKWSMMEKKKKAERYMHNQILWLKLKFSSIFFPLNSNQAEHEKRKVDRTKSWNLLSCHLFLFFLLLKYIRIKIIYRNSNFLSFFLFSPQPNPIKPRSLVFSVLMSLKWPTTKKTKNKSKSNYPTQIQFFFPFPPFSQQPNRAREKQTENRITNPMTI